MRLAVPAFFLMIFMGVSPLFAQAAPTPDEAERIYGAYGDAIYQIQVIDKASDKKSAIGSAFQFSGDGLIATNYHVVAEAVQRPEGTRLEYLHDRGGRGTLKILTVDTVHDLAILKMDTPGRKFLQLGTSQLPKGARLFSLGNPHDIGFTIVEGTYNGLSRESFIDKIHFSGALNPGMSGGPALGHDGRVAGVNVATAGNQIGFLVPVEPLRALLASLQKDGGKEDFLKTADAFIEEQLLKSQNDNIGKLLQKTWDSMTFGGLSLPGRIDPVFKCWGAAAHADKDPYTFYRSTCSSQENIFLDENFTTGTYVYRYDSIHARNDLNLLRFYNFYQQQYDSPLEDYRNAEEQNATNFECNTRFVNAAGHLWKTAFCIRKYKKYPKLYDMHLYMAMLGQGARGLLISMAAEGVSKDNALALASRFISEIRPLDADKNAKHDAAAPAPLPATPPAENAEAKP